MPQGKASSPEAEKARKAKLAAATRARYALKRQDEAAANPPPEPGIAQRSHTEFECRKIERDTGLVHAGWADVGGKFRDEHYNSRTYRIEYEEADAGPLMQVPVFLSVESARRLR